MPGGGAGRVRRICRDCDEVCQEEREGEQEKQGQFLEEQETR
jgi:hypothetical protein